MITNILVMANTTAKKRSSIRVESARIAQARRIRAAIRKFVNMGAVFLLVSVVIFSAWAFYFGIFSKWSDAIWDEFLQVTSDMGMNLKEIYLDGWHYTTDTEIMNAVTNGGTEDMAGKPLFGVPIQDIKGRIEKMGWIKRAEIERRFPDSLRILIIEREPVAVWQYQGELGLVDRSGTIISKENLGDFSDLPVIVGEDANKHINSLLTFLTAEPELMKMVSSVIRIGGRRWNVRLKNNIEIKLPEENPDDAWRKLSDLHKEKKLLNRAIMSIDLRVEDRMFIQVLPDDES